MVTLSANEICKVRSSAVGGSAKGYDYAIVKRTNKNSLRVSLLSSTLQTHPGEVTVTYDVCWKLKSSVRNKAMTMRMISMNKAPLMVPEVVPVVPVSYLKLLNDTPSTKEGLHTVKTFKIGTTDTMLNIVKGSVLSFQGDAIVNAANNGCIGGGGIDGAINDAAGPDVIKARKALPEVAGAGYPWNYRCDTGDAKVTIAGRLPCDYIIHAVGPNFSLMNEEVALQLLKDAYKASLIRARELSLESVAFCIISGGIYRGMCPLLKIVEVALYAIAQNTYPMLKNIYFCGFTSHEIGVLDEATTINVGDDSVSILDPVD